MDDLLEGALGVVFVLIFAFGLAALAFLGVANACRSPSDWVTHDNRSPVDDRITLHATCSADVGRFLFFFGLWCAVEGGMALLLVDLGEAGRSPGALLAYLILFALFFLVALVGARIWRYYARAAWLVVLSRHRNLVLRDTAESGKTKEPLINSHSEIPFSRVSDVEAAKEEVAVGGTLEAIVLRPCCAIRHDPDTGLAMASVHCVRIGLVDGDAVHTLHIGGCALVPDSPLCN